MWISVRTYWLSLNGLRQDQHGGIAIVLALAIVPLVAFSGLAIDTGRSELVRARLSQSLDAAALAGGRVFFEARRDSDIGMYFAANYPAGYMDAAVSPISIVEDRVRGTLTVSATATVPTTFMSVLGFREITVSARTVVERADRGMELVLVMDNTGSMYQGGRQDSRINRMRAAAHELVNILYEGRDTIDNLWVGLVPYTAAVNVGAGRTGWLVQNAFNGLQYPAGSVWKGCVEARQGAHELSDAPPGVARLRPFFFPAHPDDNAWPPLDESERTNTTSNEGRGPNLGCGPPVTSPTASRQAVRAAIDGMNSWHRGGTITSEGLAWAWRMLSPRWRGLWGGATPSRLPLDYGVPLMRKVVIVLTDGKNELYTYHRRGGNDTDYTAYGRVREGRLGTTGKDAARRAINRRTARLCEDMKAQGIIIYTITFEVDNDSAGQEGRQLFRECATTPAHYFDNPVGTDLSVTFRTIANQLGNLRIAE